jgi:hypothetical protein
MASPSCQLFTQNYYIFIHGPQHMASRMFEQELRHAGAVPAQKLQKTWLSFPQISLFFLLCSVIISAITHQGSCHPCIYRLAVLTSHNSFFFLRLFRLFPTYLIAPRATEILHSGIRWFTLFNVLCPEHLWICKRHSAPCRLAGLNLNTAFSKGVW